MTSLGHVRAHLVLLVLATSTLARCSCEEEQVFVPGVVYEPAQTLDFGEVAVDQEKTLDIKVISNGSAALKITQYTFPGATPVALGKFKFESQACAPDAACTALKPELTTTGVRPGETSSITVSYRPCPDAWDGSALKVGYDFGTCPTAADDLTMVLNDNSRDQTHTIQISGTPAQRPKIAVYCNRANNQCNKPIDSNATECTSLGFGSVTAGDTPCDIEVEVRNLRRDGKPTGALHVDRLDLYVTDVDNLNAQVDGKDVGFSFLDTAGAPLVLPIEVPIPVGAQQGSAKLKVRFDGSGNGVWFGSLGENRGLRVYHDDPDPARRPVVGVTVTAVGAAPEITVLPASIDYGPVEQNTTRTATVVVGNAGSGALTISDIRFRNDTSGRKFAFRTDTGMPPFTIPANTFQGARIYVSYTPVTAGQDRDELLIGSNDPNNNPVVVPLSGGATPRIKVVPDDTLVFELPNPPPPPPAPPRSKTVRILNIGYGDLVVQQLELFGPDDTTSHPSVDDFSVMGCAAFPCTLNRTLCPPSSPTCTMPGFDLEVVYRNNDNSTQDYVSLKISSTDPSNPTTQLVLSAEDRPCLSPTPVIMVDTPNPTAGTEVCVTCNSSSAGGPPGAMPPTTITGCDWAFAFAASSPIPTFAPNPGTRACFLPTSGGLHIVSLNVTNSCGATASTPATEVVTIRTN